jgi:hypothetical protein
MKKILHYFKLILVLCFLFYGKLVAEPSKFNKFSNQEYNEITKSLSMKIYSKENDVIGQGERNQTYYKSYNDEEALNKKLNNIKLNIPEPVFENDEDEENREEKYKKNIYIPDDNYNKNQKSLDLKTPDKNTFGAQLKGIFTSLAHKIELGTRYSLVQSLINQEGLISDVNYMSMKHSYDDFKLIPYLKFKSQAYSIPSVKSQNLGWYAQNEFNYFTYYKQKGIFSDGTISSDDSQDIGTSLGFINWSFKPTFFYMTQLSKERQYKNKNLNFLAFEFSFGVGASFLWGKYYNIVFLREDQINSIPQDKIFKMPDGTIMTTIGGEEISSEIAPHFTYGISLKYIIKNYNINFGFDDIFVYRNSKYFRNAIFFLGLGYSF